MGLFRLGQGKNVNEQAFILPKAHVKQAIYISAELSAPAKQLPLAINSAVPTIIFCFITANAAYYILLPWNVVATTDSVAVVCPSPLLLQTDTSSQT